MYNWSISTVTSFATDKGLTIYFRPYKLFVSFSSPLPFQGQVQGGPGFISNYKIPRVGGWTPPPLLEENCDQSSTDQLFPHNYDQANISAHAHIDV